MKHLSEMKSLYQLRRKSEEMKSSQMRQPRALDEEAEKKCCEIALQRAEEKSDEFHFECNFL